MRWLSVLSLLVVASSGFAEEREVWGKVISATPIVESQHIPPDASSCNQPKPRRDEGLSALLAWELASDCRATSIEHVAGYKVRYEWAGKRFTTQRRTEPGERIPLTVDVQLSR